MVSAWPKKETEHDLAQCSQATIHTCLISGPMASPARMLAHLTMSNFVWKENSSKVEVVWEYIINRLVMDTFFYTKSMFLSSKEQFRITSMTGGLLLGC